MEEAPRIAVVIPCYKARDTVGAVIQEIGPLVQAIYVVDDACPQKTGDYVAAHCDDPRVRVICSAENLGVGGAMAIGYSQALQDGATIVVKMDSDGQMDAALLPRLVQPVLVGHADYAKGNRFAAPYQMRRQLQREMPILRLIGNSVLSFLHKSMSGYWNIMDPTNGYSAIHRVALENIDLDKLSRGYFFENDLLFQLSLINAVVRDVPMPARYGSEQSNLQLKRVLCEFPPLILNRFCKRVFYKYFINDFNVASLELLIGLFLTSAGTLYGSYRWIAGLTRGLENTAGTVMLCALPIILGFQLLLSAVSYDINNVPKVPLNSGLN
jgi:glycosyltransferase involved in cell wall biosynthesis